MRQENAKFKFKLNFINCNVGWEENNNLTSNLFTLVTTLITHKIHQTYAHNKPYTKNILKREREKKLKLYDVYNDSKSQVQKIIHS